jgi:dephospho-CoA kinase
LVQTWGERYLTGSGEVDRVVLRSAVFNDPVVRKLLEDILHPLVRKELLEAKTKGPLAKAQVAEVPLLFESGWQGDFDYIVCVTADPDLALQRVVDRDSVRPADVEKITAVQMDPALKIDLSDYHIDNSGSMEDTEKQVKKLAEALLTPRDMNKSK